MTKKKKNNVINKRLNETQTENNNVTVHFFSRGKCM